MTFVTTMRADAECHAIYSHLLFFIYVSTRSSAGEDEPSDAFVEDLSVGGKQISVRLPTNTRCFGLAGDELIILVNIEVYWYRRWFYHSLFSDCR